MSTVGKVVTVIIIQLAVLGIILCTAVMWAGWAYNTPVTDSLTRVAVATERVLSAADRGLQLTNRGLSTALGAVSTIDGATRAAGQRITETSLVFTLLERTVGDTLFPRVLAAQETVTAVADTVVGLNDALEAANRLPFVEVPTLTTELSAVGGRLSTARGRVDEIQTGIRAIKEQKVSRPVAFITDRTGALITDLEGVLATTTAAQTRINVAMARLAAVRANLARTIDLISVAVTLAALWFIGVQGYALLRAYERLAGRPIEWERLRERMRSASS